MSELREETVPLASGREATVLRGGVPDAPTVVFLHGANGAHTADPFLRALADRFHVVAPLCPGFRDLTELDSIATVHDLVLWYDDLLRALRRSEVTLVGHSFGGMIAAEYAAHFPDDVAALVLIGSVGLWDETHPVLDLFALPAAEISSYVWADPDSEVARSTPLVPSLEPDDIVRMVQGLTTAGKFMMPIPDRGLHRRLYRIEAPTLLLWGAKDKIVPPEYADDFARGIAGAEVLVLADAGHMVIYERTADVLDAVDAHIAKGDERT